MTFNRILLASVLPARLSSMYIGLTLTSFWLIGWLNYWSCDRFTTGDDAHPGQSVFRLDGDYNGDVTSARATSRGLDLHYRSPDWLQSRRHSRVQLSSCTSHPDITSLRTDDVTSGLSAVMGLLDEAPLFYIALTSGASFAACVSSMSPSCVVALVAVTSFVSFAVDSMQRYVITTVLHRTASRWRHSGVARPTLVVTCVRIKYYILHFASLYFAFEQTCTVKIMNWREQRVILQFPKCTTMKYISVSTDDITYTTVWADTTLWVKKTGPLLFLL